MCGIFGIVSHDKPLSIRNLKYLAGLSERRGRDSSGLLFGSEELISVVEGGLPISSLLRKTDVTGSKIAIGHSRLITNGLNDNQPIIRGGVCVIHNGIVVNNEEIWKHLSLERELEIDTEVIAALAVDGLEKTKSIELSLEAIKEKCEGVVSAAIYFKDHGKLALFSNNGSLYFVKNDNGCCFASEKKFLEKLQLNSIEKIRNGYVILDVPSFSKDISKTTIARNLRNVVPRLGQNFSQESILKYPHPELQRCKQCILPHTMPYITFDKDGICNYCANYRPRNKPKPKHELFSLVEDYRRSEGDECIIPFSGGRDSCYGLHLVVKELGLKPIAYTYDWGMVTDLGRRNISRMCSKLGVENIIIADNIDQKRKNIKKNLKAWLQHPNLGMISILTAGDKHFFKHVETVKKETGISLNLWGINPLEVTHFKSGFLGVKPDFAEEKVYSSRMGKQIKYQLLRARAMCGSLGYINSSLWDTLSGEYFRSFHKKSDYFHIFDYWRWDEEKINHTLIGEYDWEVAEDTPTTWRIGDGTAAFYNYIYHRVAGFTEHDTFRSNQIREGEMTRSQAIRLVTEENRPRYPNIKWYLDAIDMDFETTIKRINEIPTLY